MLGNVASRRKGSAVLIFLVLLFAMVQILFFNVKNGYAAVNCSDWTDYGGSQYGTQCSVTCGPGDWGYSVDASVSGRDFDSASIDGIGWIDPPGGVYTPSLPCVNGTVSFRLAVYDSTGNQSASYSVGNWVEILNPGAHIVTAVGRNRGKHNPGFDSNQQRGYRHIHPYPESRIRDKFGDRMRGRSFRKHLCDRAGHGGPVP